MELSSKAVERMAEEQALLQRCYRRMRAELGDEELRRTVDTMQKVTAILKEERSADCAAPQKTTPASALLQVRGSCLCFRGHARGMGLTPSGTPGSKPG